MLTMQLREWCEANGVTISDVARESKQTLPLVRRYWYGDTSTYDRDAAGAIVLYLVSRGATVAGLFTVTDD